MKKINFNYENENLQNVYQEKKEKSRKKYNRQKAVFYFLAVLTPLSWITAIIIDIIYDGKSESLYFGLNFLGAVSFFTLFIMYDCMENAFIKYQDILPFYKNLVTGNIEDVKIGKSLITYWYTQDGIIYKDTAPIEKVEFRNDIDKNRLFFCENGIIYQKCWQKSKES